VTWTATGAQSVTVAARNECGGVVSETHLLTITNVPPVADAGPDQNTPAGAAVVLDGSGSHDPDGHYPLAYRWAQSGGPQVALDDPHVVSPTFTAPDTPTVLTFTLAVTDAYGLPDPTPDEVVVAVEDVPVAGLSADASSPTTLGEPTFLIATVVSGTNVVYDWALGDGQSDAGEVVSHTYPADGVYTAIVTASNGTNSLTATATVTVTNEPPVADAGPDRSVLAGAAVVLDGSGSHDPDGHYPLAYGWAQSGGPQVALDDPHVVSPTFTAPDTPALLTFTLAVTDAYGLGALAPDEVVVTVACVAPAGVTLSGPPTVTVGSASLFIATAWPLTTTLPLTYTWQATGQPPVVHIGGVSDTVVLTWSVAGPQTVTVTVESHCGAAVSDSQTLAVEASERFVYLPLVLRASP
jgi:PKD repeat protein